MNEREIFVEALEKDSPEEIYRYLDEACRGDARLRSRIELLLRAHEEPDSLLEHPVLGDSPTEGFLGNTDRTGPDSPAASKVVLDFLEPSDEPGHCGRLGHFEVIEVVGEGGMGVVLKADDSRLHRVISIKVLAPHLASNATARKRFLREAEAAAAVSHPHVVAIYSIDDSHPLPYLVMEYVDGKSLQQRIDENGPLELKEILRVGSQIAFGLAAAHDQGLIHRDIKPSNILLENDVERVRITDFGLARAVDDVGITRTGEVAGTPQYMSPEQAHSGHVDQRSDLFSLGCVLYAMCTGRSPFRAETTIASIRRVCDDKPRPVAQVNAEIPQWLEDIIDRLLEKNPDDRISTATEVAELLGGHLAHLQDPDSAPQPDPLPQPRRKHWPGHQRWLAAAAILLTMFCTLGFTEATGVTDLAATVIRIVSGEGTLIVEVDDPTVKVSLDGEDLRISGAGIEELKLRPGQYRVRASNDGESIGEELVTINRDGRQVVKVSLEGVRRASQPSKLTASLRGEALIAVLKAAGARVVQDGDYGVLLDLSASRITDADLEHLKNLLKLRRLTLNDRQVTHAGLDHVKELTSLRSLNLSRTRLNDAGLEQLKGMTWLIELDVHGTQITDAGMEYLKGMIHLKSLWFGETSISDKGLEHLKGFTNLTLLEFAYTNVTNVGLEHLKGMKNLTFLFIHGTHITDAGLGRLEALTNLRSLSLNGNQISDVAVTHLNRLETLEQLTAWNLTNAKLAPLTRLIHVESLELADDRITDAGIVHLEKMTNLKELDLTRTRITADGLKTLRQALPDCEIRWDEEGERPEPGKAVPDTSEAFFQKLGAEVELNVARRVVALDFTGMEITPAELQHLKGLPELRKLNFKEAEITDAGLENLKGLSQLTNVYLQNTPITDSGLAHLQGLTRLRVLMLNDTRITDIGLEHIKGLTNLEELGVARTGITDAGLKYLEGMTNLKQLDLTGNVITDVGLEHVKGLSNLSVLACTDTLITDVGLEHLQDLTRLVHLELAGTRVTGEGLARLSRGQVRLGWLYVSRCRNITDASVAHLKELTTLAVLDVKETRITAEGIQQLKEALPNCEIQWKVP